MQAVQGVHAGVCAAARRSHGSLLEEAPFEALNLAAFLLADAPFAAPYPPVSPPPGSHCSPLPSSSAAPPSPLPSRRSPRPRWAQPSWGGGTRSSLQRDPSWGGAAPLRPSAAGQRHPPGAVLCSVLCSADPIDPHPLRSGMGGAVPHGGLGALPGAAPFLSPWVRSQSPRGVPAVRGGRTASCHRRTLHPALGMR